MKKIGIATVYTGFNYGSCLQAYASQTFIREMGYETTLLSYENGLVKGRDIRIEKLLGMGIRTIFRPTLFKKTFLTYKNSLGKEIDDVVKTYFINFQNDELNIKKCNNKKLRAFASDKNTLACVCGSDQIWNATNVYIDPLFYLRFVPKNKRVAYAPSLGKSFIPEYNKKIIKKYVNDFDYISVREEQGQKILSDLVEKDIKVVLDPTLMLNSEKWNKVADKTMELPEKYMLVYFLDKPTEVAIKYIEIISKKYNLEVIAIPYKFEEYKKIKGIKFINAGPKQFLNLVNKSKFVCTDSFHGMIFSANFNRPFYTFQRNYGTAVDQSSRITSILGKLQLESRFIRDIYDDNSDIDIDINFDFSISNKLLEKERKFSANYLKNAFYEIEKNK